MKNLINRYYEIIVTKIYNTGDIYYFFYDNNKYYFLLCDRSKEDIDELIQISKYLNKKKIPVHSFMLNKDNSYYTNYNDNKYILLRVNTLESEEMDEVDIIKFNRSLISRDDKLFGKSLYKKWCNTVDEYESQVLEYNKEYKILTESFNYFIGYAENAINIIKEIKDLENFPLYISHKKINYPLLSGNFYNPLNYIYDYELRDMSEYVKEKFLNDKMNAEDVIEIFENNVFSSTSIKVFYARLLFPTYYFNEFKNVINNSKDKMDKIIDKSEKYRQFLKKLYLYFKEKLDIPSIEWISK